MGKSRKKETGHILNNRPHLKAVGIILLYTPDCNNDGIEKWKTIKKKKARQELIIAMQITF